MKIISGMSGIRLQPGGGNGGIFANVSIVRVCWRGKGEAYRKAKCFGV